MEAIGVARMAASQSATNAMNSYMAAKNALADVEDFKALDMDSYDMAMAQVTAAKMAYDAAMAASNMAADAMLLADAQMYQTAAATAMANANERPPTSIRPGYFESILPASLRSSLDILSFIGLSMFTPTAKGTVSQRGSMPHRDPSGYPVGTTRHSGMTVW